jgi:site-specific recombinase XerD
MNSSAGSTGTSHTLTATQQYLLAKRTHSTQSSSSLSATDLRELTHTLQELNNNFKKNIKVLTEIKDYIVKVCEKQDTRPVDDNSGVHKLEKVRAFFVFLLREN